jgi:predicted transcriptional regulator
MMSVFSVRLDEQSRYMLDHLAAESCRSKSAYVRWLIHNAAIGKVKSILEDVTVTEAANSCGTTDSINGDVKGVEL